MTIAYDRLLARATCSSTRPLLPRRSRPTCASPGLRPKVVEPSWSPDGRAIAFSGTGATPNTNIYVADRDGKNIRVLTHFRHGASATGLVTRRPHHRLHAPANAGLRLVSAIGGPVRSSTTDGTNPSWNPERSASSSSSAARSGNAGHSSRSTPTEAGSGASRTCRRTAHRRPGRRTGRRSRSTGRRSADRALSDPARRHAPPPRHHRRAAAGGRPAWSPDSRYLAAASPIDGLAGSHRSRHRRQERTGVTVATGVRATPTDPSWSSR